MSSGDELTLFETAGYVLERADGEALDRHVTSRARPLEQRARARWLDPITSHEAAASVTIHALTASQHLVARMLEHLGPSTLEELVDAARENAVPLSDSRIRTACAELVDLGRVADTGEHRLTRSNRRAAVKALVAEQQGEPHQ